MTKQTGPNRRFRRLWPAAVAAVTIAASAPFASPGVAHAAGHRPHVHATPPGKIAALTQTETAAGPRVQGNSAT